MEKNTSWKGLNVLNDMSSRLKSNKLWIITGLSAAVFLFIMFYMAPFRIDDLVWGSKVGIDRLKEWFEGYNGRYIGNLIVIVMTRMPVALRAAFQVITMFLLIKFIYDIIDKNDKALGLFLALFVIMPLSLFTQTITWVSGFANYVTSAVLLFLIIKMVLGITLENKEYSLWLLIFLGVLSFASQFILETATIYLVVFDIFAIIMYMTRFKKFSLSLIINFVLAVAGALCMFMNSAYSAALKGESTTTYKEIAVADNIFSLIGKWWLKFVDEIVPKWMGMNHFINIILILLLLFMWGICAKGKFAKVRNSMQIAGSLLLGFFIYDTIDVQWEAVYSFGNEIWAVVSIIFLLYIIVTIAMLVSEKIRKIRMLMFAISQFFLMGPLIIVNPISDRCFLHTYIFWGILAGECFAYVVARAAEYMDKDISVQIRGFFRKCLSVFLLAMLLQMLLGQSFSFKVEKICKEQIQLCKEQNWDKLVLPYVPYSINYCFGYNILNDDEYWIENYKRYYHIPKKVEISFMDYKKWIVR